MSKPTTQRDEEYRTKYIARFIDVLHGDDSEVAA